MVNGVDVWGRVREHFVQLETNRWLVVRVDGLAAKAAGGGEAFLLLLCVRRYGWVGSADAGHVPLFMPFFPPSRELSLFSVA